MAIYTNECLTELARGRALAFKLFAEQNEVPMNHDWWKSFNRDIDFLLEENRNGVDHLKPYLDTIEVKRDDKIISISVINSRFCPYNYVLTEKTVWARDRFASIMDEIQFYHNCIRSGILLTLIPVKNITLVLDAYMKAYNACGKDPRDQMRIPYTKQVLSILSKMIYRLWLQGIELSGPVVNFCSESEKRKMYL